MIPPERFDIFCTDWGMLRRSRRVLIFVSEVLEIVLVLNFEQTATCVLVGRYYTVQSTGREREGGYYVIILCFKFYTNSTALKA